MHLLPTTTVRLDEGGDGRRSRPARCRRGGALLRRQRPLGPRGGGRGGLTLSRLASLRRLRHPLSVDLLVEKTIAESRFVVIRCLGGLDYWRYGIEQVHAACRARGIALAVLPGDDRPDARLAAYHTVPPPARRPSARLFPRRRRGGEHAPSAGGGGGVSRPRPAAVQPRPPASSVSLRAGDQRRADALARSARRAARPALRADPGLSLFRQRRRHRHRRSARRGAVRARTGPADPGPDQPEGPHRHRRARGGDRDAAAGGDCHHHRLLGARGRRLRPRRRRLSR
jgi:cobaltochelatase CobN